MTDNTDRMDKIARNDPVARLRRQSAGDVKRQRALWAGVGAAVLAFAGLVYLPSVRRSAAVTAEVATGVRHLEGEAARAARLPRVRSAADRLAGHLDALAADPAGGPDQAGFLRRVAAAAERFGLGELRYEPLDAVDVGEGLRESPVRLRFRADFAAVHGFLRHVETLPRLLRVRSLDLRTAPDAPPGVVEAEVVVALVHRGTAD